eukprot:14360442-Alexandrium_andersonii.AAC.1
MGSSACCSFLRLPAGLPPLTGKESQSQSRELSAQMSDARTFAETARGIPPSCVMSNASLSLRINNTTKLRS